MRNVICLLALVGLGLQPVVAQNRIESDPGYVSFTELEQLFGEEPTIEINIHGALLRLVAEASALEDPELAALLRGIRGVYVRAFDLRDLNLDDVDRFKRGLSGELENDIWETVVKVRNRNEDVNMYVRLIGDEIAGMVVLSIDRYEDQTVFLNIVGDIDPEQIGRIGRKFGLEGANDW